MAEDSYASIMPSGSGIDWDLVVFKGLHIKGIYGREIFETWYKGSMMVQSRLPLRKNYYPSITTTLTSRRALM